VNERDLRATSLLLDDGPPIDPFSLAGASGIIIATEEMTLVGLGTALSIPLPGGLEDGDGVTGVQQRLAAIHTDDHVRRPGSGVLAFGSLPFDRVMPGTLLVPELLYGRSADGAEWLTVMTDGPGPPSSAGWRAELLARSSDAAGDSSFPGGDLGASPTSPSITPLASDRSFVEAVDRAVGDIRRGELRKVVLARQIELTFDTPVDIPSLVRRWRAVEPTATIFSMPVDGAQFVGASPELLVARSGPSVRCRPLAGTSSRRREASSDVDPSPVSQSVPLPAPKPVTESTRRSVTESAPQSAPESAPPSARQSAPHYDLRTSTKDNSEHHLVVEAIADALGPLCSQLDVPASPDLIHFHNVSHLGTRISGTLSGTSSSRPTVLELVATLHPTPAVGGVPRPDALRLINELEPADRAHYAGPVGWMDAAGDGRWVVGIRAATVAGRHAHLAAGVGIVEGSDPLSELRETNWKFTAVFDALAPGHQLVAGDTREPRRAVTMSSDQLDESPRRAG
jgi:menaquinone-specific isochorismate synthase